MMKRDDDLRPEYDVNELLRDGKRGKYVNRYQAGVKNMEQWESLDVVEKHPDKVSGAWVFRGTRVPVAALFENLRDGATVEEFLEWFPGVKRAQVEAVLNHEISFLASPN